MFRNVALFSRYPREILTVIINGEKKSKIIPCLLQLNFPRSAVLRDLLYQKTDRHSFHRGSKEIDTILLERGVKRGEWKIKEEKRERERKGSKFI